MSNTVTAMSADTRERLSIPMPPNPYSIAITPDGKTAYVGAGASDSHKNPVITPINIATNRTEPAIRLPVNSYDMAIAPDGKLVYIANGNGLGTVTPVDTLT